MAGQLPSVCRSCGQWTAAGLLCASCRAYDYALCAHAQAHASAAAQQLMVGPTPHTFLQTSFGTPTAVATATTTTTTTTTSATATAVQGPATGHGRRQGHSSVNSVNRPTSPPFLLPARQLATPVQLGQPLFVSPAQQPATPVQLGQPPATWQGREQLPLSTSPPKPQQLWQASPSQQLTARLRESAPQPTWPPSTPTRATLSGEPVIRSEGTWEQPLLPPRQAGTVWDVSASSSFHHQPLQTNTSAYPGPHRQVHFASPPLQHPQPPPPAPPQPQPQSQQPPQPGLQPPLPQSQPDPQLGLLGQLLRLQQTMMQYCINQRAEESLHQAPAAREDSPPAQGLRLPKATLPHFSGQPSDWPCFWISFKSLVHENASLCEQTRMDYLVQCLAGGRAAPKIAGFCGLGQHYLDALNLLYQDYGKEEALQDEVLGQLEALPNLRRDLTNVEGLRDQLRSKVALLRAAHVPEPLLNRIAHDWVRRQGIRVGERFHHVRLVRGTAKEKWRMDELLLCLRHFVPLARQRNGPDSDPDDPGYPDYDPNDDEASSSEHEEDD